MVGSEPTECLESHQNEAKLETLAKLNLGMFMLVGSGWGQTGQG